MNRKSNRYNLIKKYHKGKPTEKEVNQKIEKHLERSGFFFRLFTIIGCIVMLLGIWFGK